MTSHQPTHQSNRRSIDKIIETGTREELCRLIQSLSEQHTKMKAILKADGLYKVDELRQRNGELTDEIAQLTKKLRSEVKSRLMNVIGFLSLVPRKICCAGVLLQLDRLHAW